MIILNFMSSILLKINKKIKMKLYSFDDYLNYRLENGFYESQLNEGLIQTNSLEVLRKNVLQFFSACKIAPSVKNNSLLKTQEISIPKIDINLLDELEIIGNRHGYIIALIGLVKPTLQVENFKTLKELKEADINPVNFISMDVSFESKFAGEYKLKTDFIFHATPTIYIEKIEKIGLSPRSKPKLSYHPDRIYFSVTLKDARHMVSMFEKMKTGYDDYSILKIKTENLKMKFYNDPNYITDKGKIQGIFTLENIKPSEIVDFNC